MNFFFPDSQDQVDPGYNFITEEYSSGRLRQRDDRYAHEILGSSVYSGILVSKSVVDGVGGGAGKYSFSQKHRFYREGVRRFFRLDNGKRSDLQTFGDCGAFSYVNEEYPPYSVDEVLDFYEHGGFDLGVSMDHVILGYRSSSKVPIPGLDEVPEDWINRHEMTIELADECYRRHKSRKCNFELIGTAQGWDITSYKSSLVSLEKMGYKTIALGGLVSLKTPELLDLLMTLKVNKSPKTAFHLFGISRLDHIAEFASLGVTSFDSTSPFRRAFIDNKNNYHFYDRNYTAIRVPLVGGSPKLKRRIATGEVDANAATGQERRCMEALNRFDSGKAAVSEVLEELNNYESICKEDRSRCEDYREILEAQPWKLCDCAICKSAGVHVAIFRGSERNKRRGMHNLHVFARRTNGLIS